MTKPSDPGSNHAAQRLTMLEETITHFERTLQDLNDVVLAQQQQLTALERRVTRLVSDLNALADKTQEVRRLEDDKPPHY
jgi:uncharacterized coiled-coil protein SlyX